MQPDSPEPTTVQPAPVPTQFAVTPVAIPGNVPAVAIEILSSTGTGVYFIGREVALELASLIRKAAQTGPELTPAATSLVVPR